MNRTVQFVICAIGLGAAADILSQDAPPVDGIATNEAQPLVFKKRPRRHYDSVVSIDDKGEAPVAPAADERRVTDGMPDVSSRIGRGFLEPGAAPPPSGPMQPQRRMARKADKEDEEWKLTSQERIQRAIDALSGKSKDEEEEASGYGWLADEIKSIRDGEAREVEALQRSEDEEKEAEMISAIIGRDLPGSVRESERAASPQTSSATPRTSPQGTAPMTGAGSPAGVRPGTPASSVRHLTDEDLREMARRAVEESEKQARAALAAEARDVAKGAAAGTAAQRPGDSPSGAPELFKWGESSGGGFAGLPSSLAPSVAPPSVAPPGALGGGAFDSSARPPSSFALPRPPALEPSSGAGWAGGPSFSRPGDTPGAPVAIQPPDVRSPGAFDAPRSPFLNTMAPASVQPSFSTRPGGLP